MDTTVRFLGEARIDSPLAGGPYVENDERVLHDATAEVVAKDISEGRLPISFLSSEGGMR